MQLLARSPRSRMGKRIRKVKVRELRGWHKDSLIGRAKAACASKAKWGINSLFPVSRQVFNHFQESGAHRAQQLLGKSNTIVLRVPQPVLLSRTLRGGDIPLRSLRPLSRPPASSLAGSSRSRKGFDCVSTALRQLNIGVLSPLLSSKSKTRHDTHYCEENLLHPSQTQYNLRPLLHTICIILRSYSIQDISINHHQPLPHPLSCAQIYSHSLRAILRIGVH